MSDLQGIVITVVLLITNAFFVSAEFSLISARRDRLETMAAQGKRGALRAIRAGEHLSMMLAAAQLGITICSILLGRIAEPTVARLIDIPLHLVGANREIPHAVSFVVALAVVALTHIVLGEMVPKNLALAGPERSAVVLVPFHLIWLRLARPVIALYDRIAALSLRLLRIEPKGELDAMISVPELAEMIVESRSEGLLDAEEHRRLTQTLLTGQRVVADVLIPLDRTRVLPLIGMGTTVEAVERAVADTGFSRFPVRSADNVLVGYLHIKDILDMLDDDPPPDALIPRSEIRPLPTVTARTPLYEALGRLRRSSSHLGRVDDGRGKTLGIVTLEDVAEEFVGTVRDSTHRIPDE